MKHLTEDELVAQALGDRENRRADAVEEHLADCPECADSYSVLLSDLAAMKRMNVPPRDQWYGERVWQCDRGLADGLRAEEAELVGARLGGHYGGEGFGVCGGLRASYGGSIFRGNEFENWKQQPPTAKVEHKAPQTKQPILVVVLDDHLDRSERFLVELKHADLDSPAMATPIRDEARSLLAANKVCREKAAETSDPELTTALDHLDQLLAEAANEPGGLNARSIARLQEQMNSDGLLFEVRVLRSRIASRKAAGNNSFKGGTT